MDSALYWFGAAHVALYAVTGALAAFVFIGDYAARRAGIGKAMIHAYFLYQKQKRAGAKKDSNHVDG